MRLKYSEINHTPFYKAYVYTTDSNGCVTVLLSQAYTTAEEARNAILNFSGLDADNVTAVVSHYNEHGINDIDEEVK